MSKRLEFSRREFVGGALSFFAAAGMGKFAFGAGAPQMRMRAGVLSDIHLFAKGGRRGECAGAEMFEKALCYFRDRGVDAVVIAGDIADGGHANELLTVGDIWRRVFPGGKRPDGAKVEKIFVYGNHDVAPGFFNTGKRKIDAFNDAAQYALSHGGNRAAFWREAFDEEYAPSYIKDVRGYKFLCAHFGEFDKPGAVAALLAAHRGELAPGKPFFYVQHYHPAGTCSAPWTWGQDSGKSTAALSEFPDAVALSGHSHTPLTDERTLWRGAFTSVGTASLKYLIPFGGRENSRIFGAPDRDTQQMPFLHCRDGHHGMVMEVFDDRIVFERRDFENDLPAAPDWVVPLPAAEETFAARAAKMPAPAFAPGAKVSVRKIRGKNRGGAATDQVEVSFPCVRGENGGVRAFDYEIRVEGREVDREKIWLSKRVYSQHYYWAPERDDAVVKCVFAASELPQNPRRLSRARGIEYRFAVSPANCFGRQGAPVYSAVQTGEGAAG